ncbi:MAG: DEAD/DEAH box helicase [Pseudomonadota bacterium]|nr:DEAD/DEAH box helicase [Pseudomonadota bacterium]
MINHLTQTIHKSKAPILCLMEHAADCERLFQDLTFLFHGTKKRIAFLPSYEVALDDDFSPAAAVVSQRLSTLHQMVKGEIDLLITTEQQALTLLPPQSFITQHVFSFKLGDSIHLTRFKSKLIQLDYQLVNQITAPRQFAIRGAIIDIYPPHSKHTIRIELDDNEIDGIHLFHIETQRSFPQEITHIEVTPSLEYTPESVDIEQLEEEHPKLPTLDTTTLKTLAKHNIPRGWHRLLPLLHPSLAPISTYIGEQCRIVSERSIDVITQSVYTPLQNKFHAFTLSPKQFDQLFEKCRVVEPHPIDTASVALSSKTLKSDLLSMTKNKRLLIVCQSYFRLHQVENILLSHQIDYTRVQSWFESSSKNIPIAICQGEIAQPIYLPDDVILPEHSMIDKVIVSEPQPQKSLPVGQLKVGDLLIHVDHGVGRFSGIETREISGIVQDFVVIQYANEDKLLFPPNQLYKIHPYIGGQHDVDALKSKKWQRRKAKAIKNIEDFSAKLLRLQANRKENAIEPIPLPNEYDAFTAQFPFTETQDQINIMNNIIADLSRPVLFDRLVCGDVGFGKTEIAMRTAFIALMNGYQVAIITPTTVLATQHYNNFRARMAKWDVSIALLSRSNTHIHKDSEKIANGDIQLVIGTHKLLTQNFSNLGLVIIDEEHKFGVKQKDSIL